jgi:hypothetical protein
MSVEGINVNKVNLAVRTAANLSKKIDESQAVDKADISEDNPDKNSGILKDIKAFARAKKENYGFGKPDPEFLERASRISTFINHQGEHEPVGERKLKRVAFALQDLGEEASKKIEESGLKVIYIDPDSATKLDNSEIYKTDNVREMNGGFKALFIREGDETVLLLSSRAYFGTRNIIHEFAHALDDILAPDKSSDKFDYYSDDPKLVKLHKDYQDRTNVPLINVLEAYPIPGVWSHKAREHKNEYIAYATEYYLADPLSNRNLERKDPEMYQYTKEFLEKANEDS